MTETIILDEIPDNPIRLGQEINGKIVVSIRYVFPSPGDLKEI